MEERKIAIPISGIDDSMIGASINRWKIICISANDDLDDTPDFAGIRGADCFGKLFDLLQWDGVYDSLSFIKKEPHKCDSFLIFLMFLINQALISFGKRHRLS